MQIAIKDAIEKETCYKVQEVNVSVMGIIVDDEEEQPVVVHEFSEEEESSERTEDKK